MFFLLYSAFFPITSSKCSSCVCVWGGGLKGVHLSQQLKFKMNKLFEKLCPDVRIFLSNNQTRMGMGGGGGEIFGKMAKRFVIEASTCKHLNQKGSVLVHIHKYIHI